MPISKRSLEDIAELPPKERLRQLKPWFLILIVLGVLAMIYVAYVGISRELKPAAPTQSHGLVSYLLPTVYAQGSGQPGDKSSTDRLSELKQDIMVGIVGVLALVLLACVGVIMFAGNAAKIAQAGEILKTVLGFFIGVATHFFSS